MVEKTVSRFFWEVRIRYSATFETVIIPTIWDNYLMILYCLLCRML